MYGTTRKLRRHALVGRILGAAADRLAALSRAHIGASLDREIRDHAFPLLTDSRGLSFPITDRQSLNHFLVYGPKSAARSRLLLDIAEARIQRGSGLLHVSTQNEAMDAVIQERVEGWSDIQQVAVTAYTGIGSLENLATIDKVFDDRWRVFVRLPDPTRDPEAAAAAEVDFCADLMRMSQRVGEERILGHWRRQYNNGWSTFTHAPTPIVFDDASRFVGGLGCLHAAMLKGLGFSVVHGLESDETFGAHDPEKAAPILANAMTKVMMGDEIEVICGHTRMPRLGPDFFQASAAVRDRLSQPQAPALAVAV
jgi:hypothetical protein